MADGQLDIEDVGEEKQYDLVLKFSQSSWMSLWAIFGLFCIVNACLFWCHYKKNGNAQRDDDEMFDGAQQV